MKKERLRAKRDFEVINLSGIPLNLRVTAKDKIVIKVAVSPLSGTYVLNSGCARRYRLKDNQAQIFDGRFGLMRAIQLRNKSNRQLMIYLGYHREKSTPCLIIRRDLYTPLLDLKPE